MKTYDFHGNILIIDIGRELRKICNTEKVSFKILTGYGSTSGISKSKPAVLKSLGNMKREGLITDYFSGEILEKLQTDPNSYQYQVKDKYAQKLKNDKDYGNDGIIFVFVK